MVRRVLAVALLFAFAMPVLAEAPKPFTSDKWGFTATFPYAVKESPSDSGVTFAAGNASDTIAYMLSIAQFSDDVIKAKPVNQLLDDAVRGASDNVQGKLVSKKEITLQGFPGREAVITKDAFTAKCRLYLVKNRLYIVMVITASGQNPPMPADDFLNSFKLK